MNKISINNTGKIDPTNRVSSDQPKVPEKRAGNEGTAQPGLQDSIEVSGKALEATNLADRVKELPDVRSELVTRFQDLIENGKYEPAGELIAEAILKEEI